MAGSAQGLLAAAAQPDSNDGQTDNSRENLLLEAESRGLLPPEKQQMLDELRSRGGIMSRAEHDVRSGAHQPDYRPQSSSFQRFSDQFIDPFGVQDEIIGAGQAVRKFVTSGGSLDEAGKAYTDAAERVRAERRVARNENTIAPEILGGFGTMGATAAAPVVQSFRQAIGNSMLMGGGFGAASGFAQGEGSVGNRLLEAGRGGLTGAVIAPAIANVAVPLAARTWGGARAAVRYGNNAVRSAQNPEQAAIENVADRMVQSGVDPMAVRAAVSPPPSRQLAGRNTPAGAPFNEEDMASIISRTLAGEPVAQIGADYGIHPSTVTRYVNTYRNNNPTPMNLIDISKEVAGEGGSAPVTRLGRAAYSLAGDQSGEAAQRLTGRQETQAGRVNNIVERSTAGGDYEATRAAGLQNLKNEADTAYRQFYAEPDLASNQLGDLMEDPIFREANVMAQRQARVKVIRRNQDAQRSGGPIEPVPTVDPDNQVFSPENLDLIQRQLRITSEGRANNPNAASHARDLREVFLDRIEQHYKTFRDIRKNYATGMGEFGAEGALEAGTALTGKLGAPAREALRGFDNYTAAQQELFRLGFARNLMDQAANPQIGGAVANRFNTNAVREIVERLYPQADRDLYRQGQRLLRDLRREAITTKTKNDVLAGARSAELGSDMGRMMEGAKAAADVATGRWGRLIENLSTRLSTQLGRRGAAEVANLLTQTDPAQLLPLLNRLARAATTTQQRQAYVTALRELRSGNLPGVAATAGLESEIVRKRLSE